MSNVCASQKTVTTKSQNTTAKITKPIHPGVLEGRRSGGEGGAEKGVNDTRKGSGEVLQSVQAQELASA